MATFSKGTGYSKSDLIETGSPIILYGRLYTKYETKIQNVDTFVVPKAGSVVSKGGEVIVPGSGETAQDISIASVVEPAGILLGGDLNIIYPNTDLDPTFLAITISNGRPHFDMARRAQGKSIVHLHNADLKQILLKTPNLSEQKQICRIFESLDCTITLHEEKKCQLERLKSALLQKMFADKSGYPTVRFVGFENAWEQCKLGDVFVESTEKSKDDNEELLSVTLKDGVIKAKSLDRKNNASFDKKNYKLVIPNDIAYNSMRMWQGALGVSKYRGIVSPAYTVIKLRNQLENPYFYQYYFKKSETLNLFRKNSQGLTSDTWNLKYPLFSRIHFFTTSIEEQQKISSLLNLLDRTITLHDHKLELLKRMKQSLLQKMFI